MILVLLIVAVVVVLAILTLGFIGLMGPFVAGLGVLLAAVVLLNPAGVGSRLRQSIAWWSIPGMRRASSRAAPFAALLLLYTVPVPLGAFTLVHTANHPAPSSASNSPQAAVGGGSPSAPKSPSAIATPAPTTATTVLPPTSTPPATPTGTPAPTPTPTLTAAPTATPRGLCGAPPNPWNYNFCGGGTISSPASNFCAYFTCTKSFWTSARGYVEECRDGDYSHSGGRQPSCSSNGGNWRPLNP